jgi:transaldolase
MTDAVVGLGSSLGDRARILQLATRMLDADPNTEVVASSRLFWTRPMGAARQPFLNGAVRLRTALTPHALLDLCKRIEARIGRRPTPRWSDRSIDLDVLLMDGVVHRDERLTLPHPGLLGRNFALGPAAEVAPDLRHPVDGRPLGEIPVPDSTALVVHGRLPGPGLGSVAVQRLSHYNCRPARARERVLGVRGSTMKIFIDTANIDEIRTAYAWGIIDGVTTNPSLIAREGGDFVETIHQICEMVKGPVSAETVSQDAEGMIREGRLLARVSKHVVVKVPLTQAGLTATKALSSDGIDVNVTLVFHAAQALIAAKAGAAYVSPFLGRLDDICTDGVHLIEQIVGIFENFPALGTEVLSASIRHPLHVTQVALAGSNVATIPFKVLDKLVNHPLTTSGNAQFLADWDTVPDNDIAGQVSRWLEARGS